MENNTTRKQAQHTNNTELSLRDIIELVLDNWKWFVLSVIIALCCAKLYLATKNNTYQRHAMMLVKEDSPYMARSRGSEALMQLNGVTVGSTVQNEVIILQSFQLMREVTRKLGLDVFYYYDKGLRTISLYDEKPFTISFAFETDSTTSFSVTKIGNKYRLTDLQIGNQKYEKTYKEDVAAGDTVMTKAGLLCITPDTRFEQYFTKPVHIIHKNIEAATLSYAGSVSAREADKMSTIIALQCTDSNVKRADDILEALLEAYKQSIIDDKNLVAQSTAHFIDERIMLINRDLYNIESDLARFKQNNRLVDVKQNSQVFLSQSQTAAQRTYDIEARLSVARFLLNFLSDAKNRNELVPQLSGVGDMGIPSEIAKLNEQILQRNRLIKNSGENTPAVRLVSDNVEQIRDNIIVTMRGHISSLEIQLQEAKAVEKSLDMNLAQVPSKEQEVLNIARQQAIKETLYTFLLNKREETALQLAVTEANVRIIEHPYGPAKPVSPKRQMIYMVALLAGLGLPFSYFYGMFILSMGIRGRADVESAISVPVLGEIPHHKAKFEESSILVSAQSDDTTTEAFRMLRSQLHFINNKAKVLMFTSTTPGEGKTFVSRNFAATLAMTGKKVLLIDTDIRKRTQTRLRRQPQKLGLTTYLCGTSDDIESLIVKPTQELSFDFLPAGLTPPNPAELLMSERLDECINLLRDKYDYIVLDNVPAQAVADAGIVNRVTDITLYVLRCGKIDRRFLPELERMYQDNKIKNMCLILNDVVIDKKRYGYGYGYGYGYHHYGYGYGYRVETKRSFLKRLFSFKKK